MVCFREWFLLQERSLVDPAVVDSYERAFQQGLQALIQRTPDPELRRTFDSMRQFRFANYIVGALARNAVHQKYDLEDCLQRVVFKMLSPVGERGLPHSTLFDIDLSQSYNLQSGNPLEARFKTYLNHELRNITMGRIPALRKTQRPGSLSIGYGDRDSGTVSPDEIADRVPNDDLEMLNDVAELLRQRSTPDLNLVDLFISIMNGEGTRVQRQKFGHVKADVGRKMIVQTIEQYAQRTQNWHLIRLLDRFQDFDATRPDPRRQQATVEKSPKPPRPSYPPDEQDYRSIVDVLERSGRQANMSVFGKSRRRWMERPPRDPSSPHPNRMADVLNRMVADGVLAKQGARYVPGPDYSKYLASEPLAVS